MDLREINSLELEINSRTDLEMKRTTVAKVQWQSSGANDMEQRLSLPPNILKAY